MAGFQVKTEKGPRTDCRFSVQWEKGPPADGQLSS